MTNQLASVAGTVLASHDLTQLETALIELTETFLPASPRAAPAVYEPRELMLARAFIVFAHAEVEDYLETCCRAKAKRALEQLKSGSPTLVATSLLTYFGEKASVPAEMAKWTTANTSLAHDFPICDPAVTRFMLKQTKLAIEAYVAQCRSNHGIKEANLLQLLIPLGVNPGVIDLTWMVELNAFGSERGNQAHRGLAGVQQINDPFAARDRITKILDGPPGSGPLSGGTASIYSLRSLDAVLCA